ncbi:MAG: translation initiation factor IF-2 [Salinivirgaceae bacterium]|jgi:translation initiation factor IF-2|nr:translation initiation factor IF-2 [Salinivirgaceae bacterium]
MTDYKPLRLSKIARDFGVGVNTVLDFLHKKGIAADDGPNTKIEFDVFQILQKEYSGDIKVKEASEKIELNAMRAKKESIYADDEFSVQPEQAKKEQPAAKKEEFVDTKVEKLQGPNVVGKIDLNKKPEKKQEQAPAKSQPVASASPKAEQPKPKQPEPELIRTKVEPVKDVKILGKIELDQLNSKTRPAKKSKEEKAKERKEREAQNRKVQQTQQQQDKKDDYQQRVEPEFINTRVEKLQGPNVVGKIDLEDRKHSGSMGDEFGKKKKRKRIQKDRVDVGMPMEGGKSGKGGKGAKGASKFLKKEVNEEDVQKQIKDTLARLQAPKGKSKTSQHRREKREDVRMKSAEEIERQEAEKMVLKVTEFVSVNELATMMNVSVTEVISTCMNLGLFVSINQRLDAETMALVADEFGYKMQFVSADLLEAITDEEDKEEDLVPRPPIITVMGHVDHGKTSLLDHIRNANVIAGEAGGITQHIGAYSVVLKNGKTITFLDTPGHEAFTAMRARGAQITDIVIIVIAADDSIMPQTIEAINHAQAAGVPIVFAINKIDKPGANPDKIKEALANMNLLVEEWGGKYQSQDISAKKGINVAELLDKVLLEAELLDLKANPNKLASGTVIESALDKGRGYVTTVLVQNGTLKVGDIVLAGSFTGHVKAMYNERSGKINEAGPSTPALILGLNGAPQAGDKFNVVGSDKEARDIANRRMQLQREQGLRTQKHITLGELGRRKAIGDFHELNIIVKADVDGSAEALQDSLIKLSTPEIQVNVIHKAVGQISESDVTLAAASDAIIVGFQVRPSMDARKLAEREQVDIRLYSIIYDAINEVKDAMEGMLSPEIKEEVIGTVEIREVFKISKVGSVAGCFVRDGKVKRTSKVRVIRDGIVVYTGELGSLKRFKDDAKEVLTGMECGLNIDKYNDIKVGDVIEVYEETEVKRTL